jgi:hypothetical protein
MHDIVTQRLNQFLVEKNITYKELSGMILMSETSLCRKLTGSRSLDLHTLISIVACFLEAKVGCVILLRALVPMS